MVERMPPDSTDTIYPIKRYSDQAAKKLSNFVVPKRHTGKERLKRSRANNNLYPVPRGKMILNTVRLQGRYRNTLSLRACMLILVVFAATTVVEAEGLDEPAEFDIPAQGLDSALLAFSEQGKIQVVVSTDAVSGRETDGVEGEHTPREALEHLLANAGLTYSAVGLETVAVSAAEDESPGKAQATPSAILMAQASTNDKTDPAEESTDSPADETADRRSHTLEFDASTGRFEILDEIIVRGSRNVAIGRSENDPQPFVVFDTDELRNSSVIDLDDFFRKRLSSNGSVNNLATSPGGSNRSSISLRGLGEDQTLILVNGRRQPSVIGAGQTFGQPDINGIPISAIERIEVLPATAAGIYGGGATGGAINIILKSDYQGGEASITYDNSFDTDVGSLRFDAAGSFMLEGGRTQITANGSYLTSNSLLNEDRSFSREGQARTLANAPGRLLDGLPTGFTTNVFGFTPLVLDDGTELGSQRTFVPVGYAGASSDGGQAFVANAGLQNTDLPNDSFLGDGERIAILNNPTVYSMNLSVRREFADQLSLYVDALHSRNEGRFEVGNSLGLSRLNFVPGSAPTNPFQNDVFVVIPYPFLSGENTNTESTNTADVTQISMGFIYDLTQTWSLSGEYSWSNSNTESFSPSPFINAGAFEAAIASGEIDVFADLNAFPPDISPFLLSNPGERSNNDNILDVFSLRASGKALTLPAGDVTIALLAERRDERLDSQLRTRADLDGDGFVGFLEAPAEQVVNSIFGEVYVPFVSRQNSRPGLRLLDLTVSGRYDDYTIKTATDLASSSIFIPNITQPLPEIDLQEVGFDGSGMVIGGRYSPVEGLTIRASFATGFLPPTTRELRPSIQENRVAAIIDPQRGGVRTVTGPFVANLRGNPELEPEQSESISLGVIFNPEFIDGLRFSADYVRIDKTDEIGAISFDQLLANEAGLPGCVVRAELTDDDIAQGFTAGEILETKCGLLNLAETSVESIDYNIDYSRETAFGNFSLYGNLTHNISFETKISDTSDPFDSVGFSNGVPELRGNFGFDWSSNNWRAGWNSQYFGSRKVYSSAIATLGLEQAEIDLQGRSEVPAQWLHDLYVGYTFPQYGLNLTAGITNVFNDYEIVATPGFGGRVLYPTDPRLRSYTLSVKKQF